MRRVLYLLSIFVLTVSLTLPAWSQERGGRGGERGGEKGRGERGGERGAERGGERGERGERGGERGERGDRGAKVGKRVVEVEAVISDVGEASISYQVEAKGKMAEKMIGIADVTRVEKVDWKPVKIKDLQVGDKAMITIYEDPEDPYFPALSVRVIGKGEVKKAKARE